MEREELFKLVETILNETTEGDMEVIREAVKRRDNRSEKSGMGNFNPEQKAEQMSQNISQQVSYSREQIRSLVQKFAADVIRQNAPELSEDQIRELLDEWVPDPETAAEKEEKGKNLPSDVLITMAQQFISYAERKMPPSQEMKLREEIPDWQKSYWEWFPESVRQAIALYLKGVINEEDCWNQIYTDAEKAESGERGERS